MTTVPEKKIITQTKEKVEAVAAVKKVTPAEKVSLAAVKEKPTSTPKTQAKTSTAKAAPAKAAAAVAPVKRAAKPIVKKGDSRVAKPVLPKTTPTPPQTKEKVKKAKLVRDSFTMPATEYAVLSDVKKACLSAGIEVKKSQLLRVGLILLSKMDVASLNILLEKLEPLKAGRPKKEK
jgi:hypothetical protein